ncbi:MAG TPA: hypothetical protein VFV10_06870, partial [Gammaproteobacteria bacterium]|nr:hypothetical protein [Gammaproteobacteria bacterium]
MIIHFGLHLDGMQPAPPRTALGETALGPGRFLALLESQLGLPPVATRPGEALLAYRACLEEVDGPDRFYHHSLATDSLGTARTLLGWRARWHEAGWRGRFEAPVSKRLADMADVERLAAARVPLDSGQRVARVAAALDSGLATQIERVVLHDEPAALPPGWRALLERFACEIASGVGPAARAVPGTDLHRVQQRLLALDDAAPHETRPHETQSRETQPRETLRRETLPLDLAGDGSLLIVRAVSRDLSAQSIAEYLRESGAADETVLVAERDGIIVDNALERVGLPRAGFQHYSRFRAVTQVLKLCLGLVWEPVSPQLLLQFLLHPVAPLPTHARSALAEAVAKEPGVGGRAWRETLREILDRLRERAESGNRSDFAAQGAALQADVAYWLEAERYSPAQGAPVAALVERAQRCTTWLAGRLNAGVADRKERDLYGAAVAQGEALIGVLADLAASGRDTIDRLTLERLLDEVTGAAPDPGTFAEAHHVRGATQPAAITRPWDTVIWWDLREQRLHDGHVWSETELAELAAEGVALPSPAERIRVESRAWRRPILCARSRAILVVHDRDEGRHPLVIQLESLARGFKETRVEEALLADGAARISGLGVSTEPLPRKALPAARRWWRLPPASKVPPREQESYSSLQKLLYYPHEWVLGYAGRLRAGRAANLARGNLLYGNLAHRLFETYFEEHPDRAHRTACDL